MSDIKTRYLPDIFGNVVQAVRDELEQPNLRYEFGHPREIAQTLRNDISENTRRFPAIFLILDTEEDMTSVSLYARYSLEVWICNETDGTWSAEKRGAENFVPILYPIYKCLLDKIAESSDFAVDNNLRPPHRKYDRYYLGKDGFDINGDAFDTKIDAIQILDIDVGLHLASDCL